MRGPARNPSQRKPTSSYPPPVFLPRRAWCKAPFTLYGFASFIEVNRYLSQYLHQSLFCQVPFLAFGILLSPLASVRLLSHLLPLFGCSLTSCFCSAALSLLASVQLLSHFLPLFGCSLTSCFCSAALSLLASVRLLSHFLPLFGCSLTSCLCSAALSSPYVTIQLLHFIVRPRQAVYYSSGKHSQSCRETKTIALCVTKCMLSATRGNTECRYSFSFRKAGQEFTDEYVYRCRRLCLFKCQLNSNIFPTTHYTTPHYSPSPHSHPTLKHPLPPSPPKQRSHSPSPQATPQS